MPFFENGGVRIHYRDEGSGPPLLIIPGGGLNGSMGNMDETDFNPITEFSGEYRCISLDIRNGSGETTGPLDAERAWDQFTDDQLALLDHLGIGDFLLMGFCIGGPLNWNLMRRAPDRVKAAVMVHPSGYNPDDPDVFWKSNIGGWGKAVQDRNASVDQALAEAFLTSMYYGRGDFLFTVDRDYVQNCETPLLVLPDDIPAHPFVTAMESALLAPNAQVSIFPWRGDQVRVRIALRHVSQFLAANKAAVG
jgi:pimeloyl-ACP methyl ester carboxylesterase